MKETDKAPSRSCTEAQAFGSLKLGRLQDTGFLFYASNEVKFCRCVKAWVDYPKISLVQAFSNTLPGLTSAGGPHFFRVCLIIGNFCSLSSLRVTGEFLERMQKTCRALLLELHRLDEKKSLTLLPQLEHHLGRGNSVL